MIGIFKYGWFWRFARKEKLSDKQLLEAVERSERGLVDAGLGGGMSSNVSRWREAEGRVDIAP